MRSRKIFLRVISYDCPGSGRNSLIRKRVKNSLCVCCQWGHEGDCQGTSCRRVIEIKKQVYRQALEGEEVKALIDAMQIAQQEFQREVGDPYSTLDIALARYRNMVKK